MSTEEAPNEVVQESDPPPRTRESDLYALAIAEGQAEGAEIVCRWLREEAGKAFAARDDRRAYHLRDTADDIVRYILPDLQVQISKCHVDLNQERSPEGEEPSR